MKKGYTVVEVMVVLFIIAVVSSGMFMVLSSSKQTWDTTETRTAVQGELRKAILRISDDLRQTSMSQAFTDSGLTTKLSTGGVYSAIYFKVPQGIDNSNGSIIWNSTAVSYTLSGGVITRANGTTQLPIASDITGLNFTRLPNDVVQIDVSGQKVKAVEHGTATVNASLESAVAVRN